MSVLINSCAWQHCSPLRPSLTWKPEQAAIILKPSAPLMSQGWNWSGCQELRIWGMWGEPREPKPSPGHISFHLFSMIVPLSLFPDVCSRCPKGLSTVWPAAWIRPIHSGMKARPSSLNCTCGCGSVPHRRSSWNHEFCHLLNSNSQHFPEEKA